MSLVPVLDGSMNWQAWRPMMMNYLLSQGQWKVITNKFPAPDYETTTTVTKTDSEGTHTETVPDISKPARNQSDIDSWFETNNRLQGLLRNVPRLPLPLLFLARSPPPSSSLMSLVQFIRTSPTLSLWHIALVPSLPSKRLKGSKLSREPKRNKGR